MPARAFISYRRADSASQSHRLADALLAKFGPNACFIDRDGIHIGDRWATVIEDALRESTVLLVVIGSSWLRLADDDGRRRIDDPNDWVRKEIRFFLHEQRKIIPILIDDTPRPRESALPDNIQQLFLYQEFNLSTKTWNRDIVSLFDELRRLGFCDELPPLPPPATFSPQEAARLAAAKIKAEERTSARAWFMILHAIIGIPAFPMGFIVVILCLVQLRAINNICRENPQLLVYFPELKSPLSRARFAYRFVMFIPIVGWLLFALLYIIAPEA